MIFSILGSDTCGIQFPERVRERSRMCWKIARNVELERVQGKGIRNGRKEVRSLKARLGRERCITRGVPDGPG